MTSTNVPPTSKRYSHELATAFTACDKAKDVAMNYFGKLRNVDEKVNEGLVSEADKECEVVIRDIIAQRCPGHGLLGEEGGMAASDKSSPLWIIDPIDGTTNYVHQLPFFCISIGLQVDDQIVVGVVDAPILKWRFHAVRGEGAFLNGEPIRCSSRKSIKEGLFATGFAYHYGDRELDEQFRILKEIVLNARGVRRAGSAALDLCMVASGIYDGYWEGSLKPWDVAAGSLIAEEAGARVTNYKGSEYRVSMRDILACNPYVQSELLRVLHP